MKIIFVSIFFFVFISMGFSQSIEENLFFSDDLNVLANQSHINLKPYFDNEVRADVAKFISADNALVIQNNQRDTALTIAFWFRPENIDIHSGTIIGEDSVYYFRYLSNRKLQFNHYYKKDIDTDGVLTDNEWQYLGFTINKKGDLGIYLNGECILTDSISSDWWLIKNEIFIGKDRYKVDAEGCIDDLKMWSKALSPQEMKEVFTESLLIPDLSYRLVTYMPLSGDFTDISNGSKSIEESVDVQFVTDSVKGMVADFQSKNSHITTSGFSFDNQMTISVWAKPTDKDWVMALAGNRDFCFRYLTKQGRLWFNVPMAYSCQSRIQKVNFGEWVHLAIAVNYNHKANFYVNGCLIDCKQIQGRTGKEDVITIGQSIWGNTFNGQMTKLAIWNRALSESEIKAVYNGKLDVLLQKEQNTPYTLYISILVAVLFVLVLFLWLIARMKLKNARKEQFKEDEPVVLPRKNALYLFETFRAFDKEGKDISHDFTPTLIRLFSLILLFPRVYNRNITSQEMSDILWDTDDVAQQKNNRGTNIHRLRTLLKQFNDLALVYRNKEWIIDNSKHLFVDLFYFEASLLEGDFNLPFKKLYLCKPIKNENFDGLLRSLNDKYIDQLRAYCALSFSQKDWRSLNKLASLWLTIDSLSEEALCYLVKALLNSKQKQKALNTYSRFSTNYKTMLNEELQLSFDACSSHE
ncbi:LamG domain-containing protein [Marinifilum sp. RC60d5]|uniref:LamG domain-containing protein n=1 Tax=Marinifilum sp. RC60d5 TaxID=3458414 RepID=UPI00403570BC